MTRYTLPTGFEIILTSTAAMTLMEHRQYHSALEAGGILLGRIFPSRQVVIEHATSPQPEDRAGSSFFIRDAVIAQQIINESWTRSQGEQLYLGEWHTHNVPRPRPSPRDRQMIREMIHGTRMDIDFLVLIIVGHDICWVGLDNGIVMQEASS